ncbi:type IV secretion system DNA-binding domain-containing protein [Xanthobacter sp. 126]|uniref:type IV secretion system DNA-binding domain-containing protein n=1 Tax=Xanthobacter sp. 126 TaxID=1131814 RepID=UPI00045E90DA|nr:type IV secretion system DNA-binding domain-containing protein [Xanthobacter sp. 126]
MSLHPLTPRRDTFPATVLAFIAFPPLAVAVFLLSLYVLPPQAWVPTLSDVRAATPGFFLDVLSTLLRNAIQAPTLPARVLALVAIPGEFLRNLQWFELTSSLMLRGSAALLATLLLCGQIRSSLVTGIVETPAVRHIRGHRLRMGRAAIRSLMASWQKRFGASHPGVRLTDDLTLPRAVEMEHILIVAGTGAGKTTIMQRLLDGALRLGDRALCIDVKGDFTARLPSEAFALFSIDDARSVSWAIGQDIATAEDAAELAIELIPESSDPSWSSGARQVFSALVRYLQSQADGGPWSWSDLDDLLSRPIEELHALLAPIAPVEASFIDVTGDTRKTAMSFYLVLVACAGQTAKSFAALDRNGTDEVSIKQWVLGRGGQQQVLILSQSPRSPALSAQMLRIVLKIAADAAADLAAHATPGPLWMFLDELPQIGKSQAILRLAAIGRSAGIRLVSAIQSPAQLREIYGRDAAQHFLDNMTTKIVGRVATGETAEEISSTWIGDRTVSWRERVGTNQSSRPQFETFTQEIPVVAPELLSDHLGRGFDPFGRPVVSALVLGHGDVARLDWPVGQWRDRRPPYVPRS